MLRTVVIWELYGSYTYFLYIFLFFYICFICFIILLFYICTLLLISLVYSSIYGVCLVGTPHPFASPLSNISLFLFFCSVGNALFD